MNISKVYSVVFIPIFLVVTLFFVLLCYLLYFLTFNPKIANYAAKLWGKAIIKSALLKVEVINSGVFDKKQGYVVMANHQSAFDIFLLYGYLPFDFTFLSKIEILRIPLFGSSMKMVGAVGVDRGNKASLKKTIKEMKDYIATNRSLLIFPEGTRSRDGKLLPFKKGGFFLAKVSNSKILPVKIEGTRDVLPKGSILINPHRSVKLKILEPVDSKDYEVSELMNRVEELFINEN